METDPGLNITFTRRTERTLVELVDQLRAEGLEWITLAHVAGHIAAVSVWLRNRNMPGALFDLCASVGWPHPHPQGPDSTSPAAWAVQQAKQHLATAMLADSLSGVTANEIAGRASQVLSRPVALDTIAGELLFHDAGKVLEPWWHRGAPLVVFPGPPAARRTALMRAAWEGEPADHRRDLLSGVVEALAERRIGLRVPGTEAPCDCEALIDDDHEGVELYRTR